MSIATRRMQPNFSSSEERLCEYERVGGCLSDQTKGVNIPYTKRENDSLNISKLQVMKGPFDWSKLVCCVA